MEKIKLPNGFRFWAKDGKAVAGIDRLGFSFPLVTIYGERLENYPVECVVWFAGQEMIESPRKSRGIAYRR